MFLLLLVIFLSLIISVIAHQPRIVNSDGTNIIEPEISKAYYSNLDREPHYYYLNSDQEFNVYINVLIPGTELTHKVSAELSRNNEIIYFLDGENHDWEFFYEEFGKDYYLKGPEIGEDFKSTEMLPAGNYVIKVFNSNNEGKYVLAVGDIEKFPLSEILSAAVTVPYLKISFFGKYYLLLVIFLVILMFIGIIYWIKVKRKKIK